MRILLDNNILIRAAASPQGPAGALLDFLSSQHILILSLESIQELAKVLHYEHVRKLHQFNDQQIQNFLRRIKSSSFIFSLGDEKPPRVVPHDIDDDVIVATAVTGKAGVLCTLDKHLHHKDVVQYCANHKIRIMTDIELLTELREQNNEN